MTFFPLGSRVRLSDLVEVAVRGRPVRFPATARSRVSRAREILVSLARSGQTIYGVNTGFGELASKRIPPQAVLTLQKNLVLSDACGVGEPLSEAESRAMLFLRANELSRGSSGCRPQLIDLAAGMLNRRVTPIVPSRGSVGASGDLAPQAHAALVFLGQGEAKFRGRKLSGAAALKAAGLKPLDLDIKEGLSLINGTQAMQAVGGLCFHQALRILKAADLAGAMSLEAMKGTPGPFDARISDLKPHLGQREAAARLRRLLRNSEIRESHRHGDDRVQDPYSLRCMPQVHGAARDASAYAVKTCEIEMNSITDNPLLCGGEFLSGGNFHGQAMAFACDHAALALTALGNISERRIFQLVSGQAPGLPQFLAQDPGLECGYMIPQVVAAALCSENKVLAHPASADSVPTCANKEDFVSMGMGAALKLKQVVANTAQIIAIEILASAQGLEFHKPLKPGLGVAKALELLRRRVPRSLKDEALSDKMQLAKALVLGGYFEEI